MAGPVPADENLPEVVPDSSPQALTQAEAYQRSGVEERNAKVPASPRSDRQTHATDPSPISPATAVGFDSTPSRDSDTMSPGPLKKPQEKRVCGVKRKTFWILLAVAIAVIIAVAVGAGVGATRGSSGSGGGSDSEDQEEGGDSPTSTSSDSPSSTSDSPSSSETFLNNGTSLEGFAFQSFSEEDFNGEASEIYREPGFFDLPFDATSYVWIRNGTECCMTFCQGNETSVGWWCSDRRQQEATSEFDRIFIGCDEDMTEDASRCSD